MLRCNMEETEYTRLHITPFNADLLKTILPPSILPNARNISYHSILTFPEKGYGYVELPTMDAEKIKKKLNGTILKGTKVRVEKARPEKEVLLLEEEEPERAKKERKTKRKRDELPGVDIGERQVKRGWTTPAKDAKKDQPVIKSKYTTGPECLFKTNLPPNVASKGKITEAKPDQKKRKPGKEAVVHEFSKTTKYATFLRGSGVSNKSRLVVEFVEGKGWVDEEGNIIEAAKKSRKIISAPVVIEQETSTAQPDRMEKDVADPVVENEESSSDSSSSGDSDSESHSEAKGAAETDQQRRAILDAQLQNTAKGSSSDSSSSDSDSEDKQLEEHVSSSDESSEDDSDHDVRSSPLAVQNFLKQDSSSSDESSDDDSVAEAQEIEANSSSSSDSSDESDSSGDSAADFEVEEPQSAATSKLPIGPSLSIKIPDLTPIASSVHPLEALYKRPKPNTMDPPKAAESSFSFFGADGDDEDIQKETHLQVPLTPFTQKDFEFRGQRSAAPTPDTAHPNQRFVWPGEKDEEEDEEDDDAVANSPVRSTGKAKGKSKDTEPAQDFQKWFYEHRGDVRRAWTRRRKAAAKEKRQRENRKSDHRAV